MQGAGADEPLSAPLDDIADTLGAMNGSVKAPRKRRSAPKRDRVAEEAVH